jgi:predicted lysophospholipase L1 biosynthesis ABC-type transport system permease subunit
MNPGIIIIDERVAQKFWPGKDPIGKRMYRPANSGDLLKVDVNTKWLTVVGVVREVQLEDLGGRPDSAGAYYFPPAQAVPRGLTFAIRTSVDSSTVLRSLRAEFSKIDPAIPLANVRTMNEYVAQSLMHRKAAMILATSFGFFSVFLSALGIYGVLAYLVTRRSREIAIRIALGSTTPAIFKLVLREALWLVASGVLAGLAGAFALRQTLQSQVYGLAVMDPIVISVVSITFGIIALAAWSSQTCSTSPSSDSFEPAVAHGSARSSR